MELIRETLRALRNNWYLSSLHPDNRQKIADAQEILVESDDIFDFSGHQINAAEITTKSEALERIIATSKATYTNDQNGESLLSPLGIAMHVIQRANASQEITYVH